MKRLIILIAIIVGVYPINAQSYKIQKAWAFITNTLPGRAMTDEDGRRSRPEPIAERFIYIETNYKGQPKIDSLWYNNIYCTATITAVTELKHKAGVRFADGTPVYIVPKKRNKLWRLQVQPLNSTAIKQADVKKIFVKGKLGNTSFKQQLAGEVELAGQERN